MATIQYWELRQQNNAFKTTNKLNKRLKLEYQKAYKQINKQIKEVWLKMLEEGQITTGAIYKDNRLKNLMDAVDIELRKLGVVINNQTQLTLMDIYRDTYLTTIEQLDSIKADFSILNEQVAKQIVNASYKNAVYSTRIWNNLSVIRGQIENAIINTAILGQDVKKASRALAQRLDVSYSDAKRITVTETARVHSEATRQSALDRGYNTYHILVEPNACEDCRTLENERYLLTESILPLHPHCKCCMCIDVNRE